LINVFISVTIIQVVNKTKEIMKAVVKVGGKQYIVTENETLLVDLLPEGTKELTLDALLVVNGDDIAVGTPIVKGVKVKAEVVDELVKADKIRIIRYKAKKRVHKEQGHRQKYSRIRVSSIK
jgi:large subunit ribosomal protein L21